jgi:predicted nucleic acid-binding protein
MTAATFVDTNILVYAHDLDAGPKRERAIEVLRMLWEHRVGRLSTQVLQEFYVNVTQKITTPISRVRAREVIRNYAIWVESTIMPTSVLRASEISEVNKISFWDGLIVATAEQEGATVILSEDFQHERIISGVRIVNPFIGNYKPG